MFELCLTTSLEVLDAAISGKSGGVPEPCGCLHAQLILECTQRRCSVVGPVTPGAACESILSQTLSDLMCYMLHHVTASSVYVLTALNSLQCACVMSSIYFTNKYEMVSVYIL